MQTTEAANRPHHLADRLDLPNVIALAAFAGASVAATGAASTADAVGRPLVKL